MDNLTAWAMQNGYDPNQSYNDISKPALKPGFVSENFRAAEFKCKCCGQLHPDFPDKPPAALLGFLEDIRAHFGKPVHINSGYRCPNHNAAVGGAKASQHMAGTASDIWIGGVLPSDVYAYADKIIGTKGGVGSYETFTHIDARGFRARW